MDTSSVYLISPNNADFLNGTRPKPVLRGGGGCFETVFAAIFALTSVVLVGFTVRDWQNYIILRDTGQVVQGRYTDKRVDVGDDSDSYVLIYDYVVDDREYRDEDTVPQSVYDNAEVGAAVDVLYDPTAPSLSALASRNNAPAILTAFTTVWVSITGVMGFFLVRGRLRRRQLHRRGKVIYGRVTKSHEDEDSDGDRTIHFDYVYKRPGTGETATHSHQFLSSSRELPKRGRMVAILYANERNRVLL